MSLTENTSGPRLNKTLDIVGRTLIGVGLFLLSFVAYQLWGTGLAESRSQGSLSTEFQSQKPGVPSYGGVVGQIEIPAIDVKKWIVAGVDYKSLERGPGLFPKSPLPGQFGNVALAGHRTTYGAPFGRINELNTGDIIRFVTKQGTFVYNVNGPPKIIAASETSVVKTTDTTRSIVTLVSCHPKWTSEKRIIVVGELQSSVTPQPATTFVAKDSSSEVLSEGWFHDPSVWPVVIALALLLIAIALAGVFAVRKGFSRKIVYPLDLLVFLPVLFFFFQQLTHLLPTNL